MHASGSKINKTKRLFNESLFFILVLKLLNMKHQQCLNCGGKLGGRFCIECGQKADTTRISIKHFVKHDLLHGVWHIEKGILFTLKEALVRPGQAAIDYISGKRIRYYNVFYLCLLLIGLNIIMVHFLRQFRAPDQLMKDSNPIYHFLSENVKFIVLGIVPLLAINAMLVFRRLKFNIAEHSIIAGMCLLGTISLSTLLYLFDFITEMTNSTLVGIFEVIAFFGILLYPVWTYWNVTKHFYTTGKRIALVVFFYFMILLELILILGTILYFVSGQSEMEIHI